MYENDDTSVLFAGKKTKADPETFEELIYDLARDAGNVYYQGRPQPGLDPISFRALDEFYAKDRKAVYLLQQNKLKPIKADPESFRPLGFGYGLDSERAYWLDKSLKSEAETVKPFAEGMAQDSKGVLWENRRIWNKPLSSTLWGRVDRERQRAHFWDQESVWVSECHQEARRVPDADPSTY